MIHVKATNDIIFKLFIFRTLNLSEKQLFFFVKRMVFWPFSISNFCTILILTSLSIACIIIATDKYGCNGQNTIIMPRDYVGINIPFCILECLFSSFSLIVSYEERDIHIDTMKGLIIGNSIIITCNIIWVIVGSHILLNLTSIISNFPSSLLSISFRDSLLISFSL